MDTDTTESVITQRDLTEEYRHSPVLASEVCGYLQLNHTMTFVDCTLGGAGHSRAFAPYLMPDGCILGIDQDDMALEAGREAFQREFPGFAFKAVKGNFGDLDRILVEAEIPGVDAFLFDLGVSSPQLDFFERGFSYREDAPLDMRMNPSSQTLTAAEVINTYNEADLARIIRSYSDEKWASRIAQFIVTRRAEQPIETTGQLVDIIKAAIPASARRTGGHPAKRTFQAIRIEVNDELGVLRRGLEAALRWLNPGGRVAVLSYHSLEDRLVKEIFKEACGACTCPPELPVCVCGHAPAIKIITRSCVTPSAEEIERNPRAHSAKLRVAEKL